MLVALLWKEWRTQRPLVFMGFGITAVLPLFMTAGMLATTASHSVIDIIDVMTPVLMLAVWPLMAAATGAMAFGADISDGSLHFLLSRPVSKTRVWVVKTGAGAAAFFSLVVGSLLITVFYVFVFSPTEGVMQQSLRPVADLFSSPVFFLALTAFAFLHACAAYCSMSVRRPMAAALAGLALAVGMTAMVGAAWSAATIWFPSRIVYTSMMTGALFVVPLGTIGVFGVAYWSFSRAGTMGGRFGWDFLRPLLLMTLVVMTIGILPSAYGGLREMTRVTARMRSGLVMVDGGTVFTELAASELTTRIVRRSLDDTEVEILVPRHAAMPTVSPNGEWIVYVSFGSYLGVLADKPHLRAVHPDGTGDHAISATLQSWDTGFGVGGVVAPDNDHVVYAGYRAVVLTSISRGEDRVLDLGILGGRAFYIDGRMGGVVGWAAGEAVELLYYRRAPQRGVDASGRRISMTELRAFDVQTEESRLIETFPGGLDLRIWRAFYGMPDNMVSHGWEWLPVWTEPAGPGGINHLRLINVHSGEAFDLSESACRYWGFSPDKARLVYGHCSGEMRTGDARTELRVRDLASGDDTLFAVIEGYDESTWGRHVLLASGGDRILLYTRNGYESPRATFAVSRDGSMRLLAERMVPVGWVSDRDALLRQASFFVGSALAIKVVNIDAGERSRLAQVP